jgi:hypothetical protein
VQRQAFEEALDYIKELGARGSLTEMARAPIWRAHCKPAELLKNDGKLKAFKQAIDRRDPLDDQRAQPCHGNPIHPDGKLAKARRRSSGTRSSSPRSSA